MADVLQTPRPSKREAKKRKKEGGPFGPPSSLINSNDQNVYFAPTRKYRPMMFGPAQAGLKPNRA